MSLVINPEGKTGVKLDAPRRKTLAFRETLVTLRAYSTAFEDRDKIEKRA